MNNELQYVRDADFPGIPILGRIAAGVPRFFDETTLGYVQPETHRYSIYDQNLYALQVTGDSMIEDGIFDGNFIVVKNTHDFANGDIVIAYVNEEATVKRIYRRGSRVTLQPANSELQPIEIDLKHTEFRLGGKVIDVIRN